MKQITTILLAGSATILMTACGGGDSSTPPDPTSPIEPSLTAIPSLGNNGNYTTDFGGGNGTSDNPYQVGSGMYPVPTSSTEYFSIEVTRDSCDVAIIDGMNITSLKVYDESWNVIADKGSQTETVLSSLDAGTYTVLASTWHSGEPSLGIYSDCITEYSNTYIKNMENGPQTFYFIKDLYKFNMATDGKVAVDSIDGMSYASIYDSDWNLITLIDSSTPETTDLFAGDYFLIPTQYVFAYRDDTTDFMFTKTY